jgi:putative chitobiose transport system permease protein
MGSFCRFFDMGFHGQRQILRDNRYIMTFHTKIEPWLYLFLPLILLIVFFLIPMGMALQISTLDYGRSIFSPEFIGGQNYLTLVKSPHFWQVMWNTIIFMVALVPAMIVVPILVALFVNNQLKGITLFRAMIYLPVVVSVVVAGIAWKWLYASDGLINYLLSFLGISKINWLVSPDIALYAIVIMIVWKGVGYYMMMYLSNLQSISHELYEAAEVDGANLFQKHWNITIPHLRPAMAMVGIISTIGSLKVFTEIYVMTRGGPVGSTETFVYYIYDQAFGSLNLGIASAAGFVLMIIVFALSLINIKYFYLKAEKEALNV